MRGRDGVSCAGLGGAASPEAAEAIRTGPELQLPHLLSPHGRGNPSSGVRDSGGSFRKTARGWQAAASRPRILEFSPPEFWSAVVLAQWQPRSSWRGLGRGRGGREGPSSLYCEI